MSVDIIERERERERLEKLERRRKEETCQNEAAPNIICCLTTKPPQSNPFLYSISLFIYKTNSLLFSQSQIHIVTAYLSTLISGPHICLWRWKTKPPPPRPDSRPSLGSEGFATTSKPRSPSHVSMHATTLFILLYKLIKIKHL